MRRFISFLALSLLSLPLPGAAVTILPACTDSGNCGTCQFLELFANWAEAIMYGLGGAAVLMIAIGGFMWILSAGNPERVQTGRKILIETIVGLLIAFLGYLIVNIAIAALMNADYDEVKLFGTDWNTFCEVGVTPGGAVTDCTVSTVGNGTPCKANSCKDETLCVCSNQVCVEKCTFAEDQYEEVGSTTTATCVATTEECASTGGSPNTGACLNGQICCISAPTTSSTSSP